MKRKAAELILQRGGRTAGLGRPVVEDMTEVTGSPWAERTSVPNSGWLVSASR